MVVRSLQGAAASRTSASSARCQQRRAAVVAVLPRSRAVAEGQAGPARPDAVQHPRQVPRDVRGTVAGGGQVGHHALQRPGARARTHEGHLGARPLQHPLPGRGPPGGVGSCSPSAPGPGRSPPAVRRSCGSATAPGVVPLFTQSHAMSSSTTALPTSSETSSTSWASQISRSRSKYPGGAAGSSRPRSARARRTPPRRCRRLLHAVGRPQPELLALKVGPVGVGVGHLERAGTTGSNGARYPGTPVSASAPCGCRGRSSAACR